MSVDQTLTRRVALLVALVGLSVSACGVSAGETPVAAPVRPAPRPVVTAPPSPPPSPLATSLLVGFSGAPGTQALGEMTGDLDAAGQKLRRQIADFPHDRAVTPVVELIATTAHREPGADGMYRSRASDTTIRAYLAQARALHGLLLLNIQPGRADFLPEVQAYRQWLTQPDVGVALDPEWAVDPGVVPGRTFGHTTGAELDTVATYLGDLAQHAHLPDKVMVYHQVAATVVRDETGLTPHPGVSAVKVVDGIGSPAAKTATWKTLMTTKPPTVLPGFKLFFHEDTRHSAPLMTPTQVLDLTPHPAYILYE